jgi:hypothetical protein
MKLCGLMVIMVAGCAALVGCSGVVSQTPAGSELVCYTLPLTSCAQQLADKAEANCQQRGLHAQLTSVDNAPLGSYRTYACVP